MSAGCNSAKDIQTASDMGNLHRIYVCIKGPEDDKKEDCSTKVGYCSDPL